MGAYLPLRNGQREFITDMDTYDSRYEEEWGEILKEQEEKKKAQFELEKAAALESEKGIYDSGPLKTAKDAGFFKLDKYGAVVRGDDPFTEEVETNKPVFARPGGIAEGLPIGLQKNLAGQGRMWMSAKSQVVNFPFALADIAATTTKEIFKSDEQREADTAAGIDVFNSMLTTGKKPDGDSYGIQPEWGWFGEMYAPSGDIQQMFRPKSYWGGLGSNIIAAFMGEGLIKQGAKALIPSLTRNIPQSYGVWSGIRQGNLSQVYKGMSSWFVKEGLYEIGLDLMFIRPDLPESWHERIAEIQKLASPQDRINMMNMITADTDEEFNLASQTLKEAPMTIGAMVLLRGVFKYANHALREISQKGVDFDTAAKSAEKSVVPEVVEELKPIADQKAAEGIEVELGKVNAEMNRLIDQSAANIAYGTREGAQSFLTKKADLTEGVPGLNQKLKETEPLVENIQEIDSQIDEIQTKYSVKTDDQITKKLKDQTKRVKDYEKEIRKNPNWIKSRSNKTKYNKAANAAKALQILQELKKARGSMVVEQTGVTGDVFDLRQGISEELESIFSQVNEGQIGFNNAINDATILVKRLEELDNYRRELLRSKGLTSEIDLQFPGVNGFVMRKLRQIINDVGVAKAAGGLNEDYMNKVVQEIDELHHKLIGEGGGMAPVVPEQPKDLNIKGDDKKIEKLTGDLDGDPWATGKGGEEIVEEGTDAGQKTIDVKGEKVDAEETPAGELSLPQAIEEISEIPEAKKKGWRKLLRTLPEGKDGEFAINRIIAAWEAFEKGVSSKNRMGAISSVGDLVRFLNIVRTMIEEGTQKGLRDVEKALDAYDKLTSSKTGRRKNLQEWFPGMKGFLKGGRNVRDIQKGTKADPKPSLFGRTAETKKELPPVKENKIRKEPSPVENEAPITTNKEGNPVVDKGELANRRAAGKKLRSESTKAKQRRTRKRKLALQKFQKQEPVTTQTDAEKKLKILQDNIKDQRKRAEEYLKLNPGDYRGASEIFNKGTTGTLYTSTQEATDAFVGSIKAYRTANKRTLGAEIIKAGRVLSTVVGNDQSVLWERFMLYGELEDISQNIIDKFHMVTAGVSMIEETTNAVLRQADVLNKYFSIEKGITDSSLADVANQVLLDGQIITKQQAMDDFVLAYRNFDAMLSATERTFYAAGNLLSLLKKENRIKITSGTDSSVFNEVNKELFERFGDETDIAKAFRENLERADKELSTKLNPTFKKLLDGETLTTEELQGFQMLVDKVRRTNGDITQLKELEITKDAILARLQVQNPLSTMQAPFNLPLQGLIDMNFQLFSRMFMMAGDSTVSKWLLKDSVRAEQSFKEFLWARDTILNVRHTYNQALKDAYWRFVTGKNIADAGQMSNKAYKIAQGGVVREQAVLDDLKATKFKLPIVNWMLDKGNMNKKAFDLLNYFRVGAKAFHDYAIPGEAWDLRSGFGRWVMGTSTSAIRKATGLGTKSYYPGGQDVNISLWGNLFAAGDEMISSMYANASVQSRVNLAVKDIIADKLSKGEWTLADVPKYGDKEYKKMLENEMKSMYQSGLISDVKAGYNNETIGKAIIDKQIHELTQIANRTEELTGYRLKAQKAIELMTKSDSQFLRWFGREIAPITVSPLNEMKKIIMISAGGEQIQFTADMVRTAAKKLPWDKTVSTLQPLNLKIMGRELNKYIPSWADDIKKFESKYTHKDPKIRASAQTALGWSIALNATIFTLTLDGEQEITGNKFYTYKADRFHKKPYTWTVGGVDVPYRYLGLLGSTIALHVNMRDVSQFGSERGDSNILTMAMIQTANTLLDTPQAQGFQQINRVLEGMAKGDPTQAMKMVSKAIQKAGSPHMTARKQIIEGFLPDISARPEARFGKGFTDRGKPWERVAEGSNPLTLAANLTQRGFEHDVIGLMANLIHPLAVGLFDSQGRVDPKDVYYRSRQAVWYAQPGDPFQSEYTGAGFLPQTILGRSWAFPNKLADPVNANMSLYLIKGADHRLYSSKEYGFININDRVLNEFNHYLQNEYQQWSLDGTELLTGAHAMLLETVNSPYYQTVGKDPDSPYKMARPAMPWFMEPIIGRFFKPDIDWNRADNPKRRLLQNRRDTIIKGAKETWYLQSIKHYKGEITLRFPMPENMVKRIQENRTSLLEN